MIKSKSQYNVYCKELETLLESGAKSKAAKEEVDLLTLLIETWDEEHNTFEVQEVLDKRLNTYQNTTGRTTWEKIKENVREKK